MQSKKELLKKRGGDTIRRTKKLLSRIPPVPVLFAGVVILVIIINYGAPTLTAPDKGDPEVLSENDSVITISTSSPDEESVQEPYIVPDGDPRVISIPKVNTNGFIQKVGIDQNGKVAVPTNVTLAGWYVHSPKPGEKGLSVIDGHVDGEYAEGIFYRLDELVVGDTLSVEYGDGKVYEFRVVDKVQIEESKAADVIFSKRKGVSNQLNLVTCGGVYDYELNTYPDRIIVITERV